MMTILGVKENVLTDGSTVYDVHIRVNMEGQSDLITIACVDEDQAEAVRALLDQTVDIDVERLGGTE